MCGGHDTPGKLARTIASCLARSRCCCHTGCAACMPAPPSAINSALATAADVAALRRTRRFVDVFIKSVTGTEVVHLLVDQLVTVRYLHFLYRCNSAVAGTAPRTHLFLPCTVGLYPLEEEVRPEDGRRLAQVGGHMTLADYGVRGESVALLQTAMRWPEAVERAVGTYFQLNFAWRGEVSVRVTGDQYRLQHALPDEDEVQVRACLASRARLHDSRAAASSASSLRCTGSSWSGSAQRGRRRMQQSATDGNAPWRTRWRCDECFALRGAGRHGCVDGMSGRCGVCYTCRRAAPVAATHSMRRWQCPALAVARPAAAFIGMAPSPVEEKEATIKAPLIAAAARRSQSATV